jgi:CHAD domain-containing protein
VVISSKLPSSPVATTSQPSETATPGTPRPLPRTTPRSREGEPAHFHEWRKRAKDLRYQLEFLSSLWPGVLPAVVDDLHELTDLLGQANDIDLLTCTLEMIPRPEQEDLFRSPMVRGFHDWQRELRKEGLRVGARLYSDKPGVMVSRMEACWEAARA